jgi:hypothetical protein
VVEKVEKMDNTLVALMVDSKDHLMAGKLVVELVSLTVAVLGEFSVVLKVS